jgi:hypothetical protein
MNKGMSIFEKYDPDTWNKDVGYPCVVIFDETEYGNVYSGRNPQEFFDVFDVKCFGECLVLIYVSNNKYIKLGKVKDCTIGDISL